MRLRRGAIVAGLMLVLLVVGCSTPPAQRIVLLPDPGGKAGAVIVRGSDGERELNQPFANLEVSRTGHLQPGTLAEADVKARYAVLLEAQAPRPQSFVVRFEPGSATVLSGDSLTTMEAMLQTVAQWPAPQITVIGHTDRTGTSQWNDDLSKQRARTVADMLIRRGVPTERVEVAGRGEREPLVPTDRGVANATNRRVEITVR